MTLLKDQFVFLKNYFRLLRDWKEREAVIESSWHWAFENGLEDWPEETNA